MEKSVHEIFQEFIQNLEQSEFYHEYLRRKEKFLTDEEACALVEDIKNLQQQRVNARKIERDDISQQLSTEIKQKHEILDTLFTTSRYEEMQKEVNHLLNYLNEQLEIILKK